MRTQNAVALLASAIMLAAGPLAHADFTGTLSTPEGVQSGGRWALTEGGFEISWDATENPDGTWNYGYEISTEDDGGLRPALSHLILELSQNITSADLFNLQGVNGTFTFGTFGVEPGNPGFPAGETIFGVKIDMVNAEGVVSFSFDSTRSPMWGDFYGKGGSTSYAYNTDLGVPVANAGDYAGTPVDGQGAPLAKILVPDTVPTPGAAALLCLAAGVWMPRRRPR